MVSVIENKKSELELLCRQYHVSRLDLFGSAAADDMHETSDLDFLVEFNESAAPNRFDNFFAFQQALSKLFNRPIDLVEPGGLRNPYFVRSVNQTRMNLYAAS